MRKEFYSAVSIFVPNVGQKLGQYENYWNFIDGEHVLRNMCDFYSLPKCYPLPDGTMGRSNWGRETYAGRLCAKLINELKKEGYSLDDDYPDKDNDGFEMLAIRRMYLKKEYNFSKYDGINVRVDGNDSKFLALNFKEKYDAMNIEPCEFASADVTFRHHNDNKFIFMIKADAVNALREFAKVFNRKYMFELENNLAFPDEKMVLFGRLKKGKEELSELSDMMTVHFSEKGKTVFSVPFDKVKDFCGKVSNDLIDFSVTDIVPLSNVKMLTEKLVPKKPIDLSLAAIRFEEDSEKNLGVRR